LFLFTELGIICVAASVDNISPDSLHTFDRVLRYVEQIQNRGYARSGAELILRRSHGSSRQNEDGNYLQDEENALWSVAFHRTSKPPQPLRSLDASNPSKTEVTYPIISPPSSQ
jgi:hypothetical protein